MTIGKWKIPTAASIAEKIFRDVLPEIEMVIEQGNNAFSAFTGEFIASGGLKFVIFAERSNDILTKRMYSLMEINLRVDEKGVLADKFNKVMTIIAEMLRENEYDMYFDISKGRWQVIIFKSDEAN